MYSVTDLSINFLKLDEAHREAIFQELRSNIDIYSKMMPEIPLIKYVKGGDSAVPETQHGPIILAYKAWVAKQ
jgi:hypothetical protein